MRKLYLALTLALGTALAANAGGLMTNTNYHIAFDRMFARGATTEIDAAYSNPAGLAWGHEGWQLSLNFQKPWQNRDIEADVPGYLGTSFDKKYNGVASAPIVPALFASYKKDRLAISGMIGIVGSGGFVEYDEGIPMFEVPLRALLAQAGMMPNAYAYSAKPIRSTTTSLPPSACAATTTTATTVVSSTPASPQVTSISSTSVSTVSSVASV